MEVLIRPVPRTKYEPEEAEAICCTYDMNASSPMSAVLLHFGLDREHFSKCASMHAGDKSRVISHGDEKPFIITTNKLEDWGPEPNVAWEVLTAADAERCESLSISHFALTNKLFPEEIFNRYLRQILQAKYFTNIKQIFVDVDEAYFDSANHIYQQLKIKIIQQKLL